MSWQQLHFYTLILGGGIVALQLGVPGLLLLTGILFLWALKLSGGWLHVHKNGKKNFVLWAFIPDELIHWVKDPLVAWENYNSQKVSFRRIVKGTLIGALLLLLVFIILCIVNL